ncbi:hypothetical protein INR49_001703 [Caranx melampygus]|nr:hypothetical protein INR49_001703 [Caranx melampygus]
MTLNIVSERPHGGSFPPDRLVYEQAGPTKLENELPSYDSVEEKQKHTEVERTTKWLKMMKSWDKYKNSEKLVRRIYKGIPLQLRGEVWCLLLDIPKIKEEKKDFYEKLKARARGLSPDIRQIDLDVNRTYRDHIMFMHRYDVKFSAHKDKSMNHERTVGGSRLSSTSSRPTPCTTR